MLYRNLLLSTSVALIPLHALAESASTTPEIVVTANRIAVPKEQVGSSVTVISRVDIEKSGTTHVFDVIKKVPGISVSRTGSAGSTSGIRIRGSNTGQVRVMIDGVFMNDPSSDNTAFDFNGLQLDDVERIEIIRGPQSALFGSDAMGGVINIITRRGQGPAKFNGLSEVGSYGTHRESAGIRGEKNSLNYSIQLQNLHSDGFSRIAAGPERDATDNKGISLALGWKASENLRLDTSGSYSRLNADFDPTATIDGPASADKNTLTGRAALTAKTLNGKWEHILSVQGARTDRDFDEPLGFFRYSTFDGRQTTAEYQSNLSLRTRDVLTGGILTEKQEAKNTSTSFGVTSVDIDKSFRTNSLYGQYLLGLTNTTTLTVGGRHDQHSTFGGANTYRATIAQELPETGTTLRASAGTGFKAPTLFQLYYVFGGNTALKPEKSTGIDAGVEQKLLDNHLNLSATVFYNRYKNLIDYTTMYVNVNKANTRGIELTSRYDLDANWQLYTAYTYMLAEDDSTNGVLPRRPKNNFTAGVDYTVLGGFNLGADLRYVSAQLDSIFAPTYTSSYSTIDLHGSYDLTPQVAVYGRLENLFDRRYQEVWRYNAPGRSVYVGVKGNY